jgi:hypothetical protein
MFVVQPVKSSQNHAFFCPLCPVLLKVALNGLLDTGAVQLLRVQAKQR